MVLGRILTNFIQKKDTELVFVKDNDYKEKGVNLWNKDYVD